MEELRDSPVVAVKVDGVRVLPLPELLDKGVPLLGPVPVPGEPPELPHEGDHLGPGDDGHAALGGGGGDRGLVLARHVEAHLLRGAARLLRDPGGHRHRHGDGGPRLVGAGDVAEELPEGEALAALLPGAGARHVAVAVHLVIGHRGPLSLGVAPHLTLHC